MIAGLLVLWQGKPNVIHALLSFACQLYQLALFQLKRLSKLRFLTSFAFAQAAQGRHGHARKRLYS